MNSFENVRRFIMHDSVKQLEKNFYQLLSEETLMQEFLDDEAFAGIWFWDLQNRNTIWLSKSLRKLIGFTENDLVEIPRSWEELLSVDNKENICRSLDAYVASESSKAFDIQIPFLQKNNQSILLRCKATVVKNKAYLLGLVQVQPKSKDIRSEEVTEFPFKKNELKSADIEQSKLKAVQFISDNFDYASKYESLIIAGNLGGWEYKVSNGDLWCSREYFDLLGYDTSNIESWQKYDVQKVWLDLLHPDEVENARDYFANYLKELKGVYRQNFRMKHASGKWVWISSKGKVMNEKINGVETKLIIGTHTDISESKRLEEELYNINKIVKKDNALLKSIITSPKDIFIVSIDTNYCYTSFPESYKKYVKERFGKDIHIGYQVLDIFSETQLSIFKKGLDAALGGMEYKLDVSLPLNSTELTYIENRYNPIQDEFGNIIGATVFIQDVTKVKNAETANRINELRYSSLFTASGDAIFIANVKTGLIVDVNPRACELLGYEKSELIGIHISMLHPIDDLEFVKQKFKDLTSGDKNQSAEVFIQHKNGKRIPILITTSNPFQIGDDVFSAAYFKDLTTAKEIESNASNLLELLKTAEMLSTTGSVEIDIENKKIIWSDEFFKILGYEPQSFELNNDSLYNHIHAEDRDAFVQWQESAMKTAGQSATIDLRILKNDGTISVVRTTGLSFADIHGNILKFVVVAKDITIRNRISEELNKQNKQLKDIAWTQSHLVRAPLTRLMGLVQVLQKGIVADSEKDIYFKYVLDSANELDHVIKEITARTIA